MVSLRDLTDEKEVLIVSPRLIRGTTVDERRRAYTDPEYAHQTIEWAILDTEDPVEISDEHEYSHTLDLLSPIQKGESTADDRGRVKVGKDLVGERVTIAVLNVKNGADES